MLASGMAPGSGLHLVDTRAKTVQKVFAAGRASVQHDKTRFGLCPGPLDAKQALLHGLSLRPAGAGRYTVYATNHGGRESIEVFEIDMRARSAAPPVTWVGCVPLPDKLAANSVAAFTDGTLVATVLILPGNDVRGRVRGPQHGCGADVDAGDARVPPAAGHGDVGEQRHRDVA